MTTILMIRPVNFGFNRETAESNPFQHQEAADKNSQQSALAEFDHMVKTLKDNGIDVIVVEDTAEPIKPDSIFPNNWVSFHENGQAFLYPMQAVNRRAERRMDIIDQLKEQFDLSELEDLSEYETSFKYLEGTGSMVLDRNFKIAYACVSPRTNLEVLNEFCRRSGYKPLCFCAVDDQDKAIYHTNVLMCVASEFVVICFDSIKDQTEKELLRGWFEYTGKRVIEITIEQMKAFAGNMLELKNNKGENVLVMSARALKSLTVEQVEIITAYCKIIDIELSTIENIGGGSARCMMTEVSLPGKE